MPPRKRLENDSKASLLVENCALCLLCKPDLLPLIGLDELHVLPEPLEHLFHEALPEDQAISILTATLRRRSSFHHIEALYPTHMNTIYIYIYIMKLNKYIYIYI